jgi:hypothetical protein
LLTLSTGALNFQESLDVLSPFLVNIIGLFFATNLSCFKECITGAPAVSSIVPVLLVLAPGSVVGKYFLHYIYTYISLGVFLDFF